MLTEGIELLLGKTLIDIKVGKHKDYIVFTTSMDEKYIMYHAQDCCESVRIEDVSGDLTDLIGSPILKAEESTTSGEEKYGTSTYTFYQLATIKGYVDIRWYGSSNGWYGEEVWVRKFDPQIHSI